MGSRSPGDSPSQPSALALRHLEDLFGSDDVPMAAVQRLSRKSQCLGALPLFSELSPHGRELAAAFRALPPEPRARLLAFALQGEMRALSFERAAAASAGFIEILEQGRVSWATDLHRVAVLAAAEPDDHRLAGGVRCFDGSHGGALHRLFADEAVETVELTSAAEFYARADRPSWALHCLVSAADLSRDSKTVAALGAAAANLAAFEGDFGVSERVLERFTASDTRVLIRESAPARALRQALVESDTAAARATVLTRLASADLGPDAVGELLAVYALINLLGAQLHEWEGFVRACHDVGVPLHPELQEIAGIMREPNAPSEGHLELSAVADGRGWSQLAGCVATILYAYRDMRLSSFAPPSGLTRRVGNRLVRATEAVYVALMLAHSLYWNELETTLDIAIQTTKDTVPVPLMRVGSQAVLAYAKAFQGDREAALEIKDRVMTEPVRRLNGLRPLIDSVAVMIEGPQGNYEHAMALMSTRRFDVTSLTTGPCGPVELFDFVDYAILAKQEEIATARVEQLREALLRQRSERAGFVLAACDAALSVQRTLTPAEDLLAQAEALPFVYEAARLRLVYAEKLRRSRRTAEARRHLLRVEFDLMSVQAGAWLDRVRRELRACQREVVVGIADLTEQEMRIAELAAGGLSNKEIGARLYLSPRTVSGHLYKIFPKLGIGTRAQLRDALVLGSEAHPGRLSSE